MEYMNWNWITLEISEHKVIELKQYTGFSIAFFFVGIEGVDAEYINSIRGAVERLISEDKSF